MTTTGFEDRDDGLERDGDAPPLACSSGGVPVPRLDLEAVLDLAPVGVAVHDSELRIVRINDRMAEINGIDRKASLGRRLSELLPDLAALVEPKMRRVLDTGEPIEDAVVCARTRGARGGRRHWLASYHPIPSGSRVDGVAAFVREITAQRHYEQRLRAEYEVARLLSRESDPRVAMPKVLESIARALELDVCEYWERGTAADRLRRVALCTPRRPEWAEAEILAKPGFAIGEGMIGRAWQRRATVWLGDVAADPSFVRGDEARRLGLEDGLAIPVVVHREVVAVLSLFTVDALEHGDALFRTVRSIARTIGEFLRRTRAERALRASEDLFRGVVEHAPIPMFLHSASGGIEFVNAAFTASSGYSLQDVDRALRVSHGRPSPVRRPLIEVVAELIGACEVSLRTRDGEERRWLLHTSPELGLPGARQLRVTSAVDITSRHAAQRAHERAQRQAEQANRAKTEFLGAVSHEIRTPMSAVLGFADVLRARLPGGELRECAETIHRNGRYLVDLLDDLVDVARIEAGRLELEPVSVSPAAAIDEVARLMDVIGAERGIPIAVHVADDVPPAIATDPKRLRQVLINLVSNALKFTESGEVRIRARRVESGSPALRIEVADSGVGIHETMRNRIFGVFERGGTRVGDERPAGVGLGLWICRNLAEALGWDLDFESDARTGTTFRLTIPLGGASPDRHGS